MSNIKLKVFMKKWFLPFLLFFISISVFAQGEAPVATTATSGKLTVSFSTNNGSGNGQAFSMAIYITNSSNQLVNTLFYRTRNGDSSAQDMTTWWPLIGSSWSTNVATTITKTKSLTDASTGATATNNLTNQIAYWGNNAAAANAVAAVADGTYKVNFEIINYKPVSRQYYSGTFTKGPIASNSTVTATIGFSGISIVWTPVNTAINDVELEKMYSVYPNPTVSSIFITGSDIKEVEICSLNGKSIFTCKEQKVDLSRLAKGLYLAVIRAKTGTIVKKIEKL